MNVTLRHDSEIRELVAQQPVLGMVGVEAVDDLGHRRILSGAEPMFTGYELPKQILHRVAQARRQQPGLPDKILVQGDIGRSLRSRSAVTHSTLMRI